MGLIALRFYTDYLEPVEFGQIGLIISTSSLAVIIIENRATVFQQILLTKNDGSNLRVGIFTLNVYLFGIVFFSIIFGSIINSVQHIFNTQIFLLISIFVTSNLIRNMVNSYHIAIGDIKFIVITDFVGTIFNLTISLILIILFNLGVFGYVIGNISGNLIIHLPNYIYRYAKIFEINFNLIYIFRFFKFGVPLTITLFLGSILHENYVLILNYFAPLEIIGYFYIILGLYQNFTAINRAFIQAFRRTHLTLLDQIPQLENTFEKLNRDKLTRLREFFNIYIQVTASLVLGIQLFIEPFGKIILSQKYLIVLPLMKLFAINLLIMSTMDFINTFFSFYEKTYPLPITRFIVISLNVMILSLIGNLSLYLIVIVLLISNTILFTIIYLQSIYYFYWIKLNMSPILAIIFVLLNGILIDILPKFSYVIDLLIKSFIFFLFMSIQVFSNWNLIIRVKNSILNE